MMNIRCLYATAYVILSNVVSKIVLEYFLSFHLIGILEFWVRYGYITYAVQYLLHT